ncbi:MAG: hypothetical protein LBR34_01030 [Prevotella sp.]|jgi:hypothetical protein|nr:hypothetical protein [Prevotella sp.]
MEITEKIKHGNAEIRLYKEGVFWVAYERSAYEICKIKPYKSTKKYVKKAAQDVVTVGFPDNALESILSFFDIIEKSEKTVAARCKGEQTNTEDGFEEWKSGIALAAGEQVSASLHRDVETKIRNFDLTNATPLQCMNFLADLKRWMNN